MRTSKGEESQQKQSEVSDLMTNIIPNDNILQTNDIILLPNNMSQSTRKLLLLKQISSTNKQNNLQKKSKIITDSQFDGLLQEHLRNVQTVMTYTFKKPKNVSQTYLPNIPPFKIPTPKNSSRKTKRKFTFKSSIEKPRLSHYTHSNNTKHNTVTALLEEHSAADKYVNINHMYTSTGKKKYLDSLLNGNFSKIWHQYFSNKLGQSAQGNRTVKENDTLDFIYKHQVPTNKKVTYANFICDFSALKHDQYRDRVSE